MDDLNGNDWVTCPYEPCHRMKYSKFHNHFVKCQKAHPEDPRQSCPYYASELIHPDDMANHLLTCKYRSLYTQKLQKNSNTPVYSAPYHVQFRTDSDFEDDDEDDDETKSVLTQFTQKTGGGKSSIFSKYSVSSLKRTERLLLEFSDGESDEEMVIQSTIAKKKTAGILSSKKMDVTENGIQNLTVNPVQRKKVGFGRGVMIREKLRSLNSTPVEGEKKLLRGLGRATVLKSRFS